MNTISDLIHDIVREHYEYIEMCEHNCTEMEKKIAIWKANARELQANTELAENFFHHQMRERERLFESASKVLDKAMKHGDVEFARIAVRIIEVVHRKSPFSFEP